MIVPKRSGIRQSRRPTWRAGKSCGCNSILMAFGLYGKARLLNSMPSKVHMKLTREILNYFLRSPHAADNLEGIARWRLLEERIQRTVEETKESLDWLLEEGYLVRRPPTDLLTASFRCDEIGAAARLPLVALSTVVPHA